MNLIYLLNLLFQSAHLHLHKENRITHQPLRHQHPHEQENYTHMSSPVCKYCEHFVPYITDDNEFSYALSKCGKYNYQYLTYARYNEDECGNNANSFVLDASIYYQLLYLYLLFL